MKNRLDFTTSSQTIGNIYMSYIDKTLNLRPEYQREYVWSDSFKFKLIYSIVRNYPIGNITIRKLTVENTNKINSEVVDGQQRLNTIFDYMDGKLIITGEDSFEIMDEIIDLYTEDERQNKDVKKMINRYKNRKKINLEYNIFPSRAKVRFGNYNLSISTINQAADNEVAEYFRFVQNQERLRAGEIINAFIESPIDDLLNANCDLEKLTRVLSFDNSRKEFNKLFNAIVGLDNNKLNLGCKDSDIIDFVRKETSQSLDSRIENSAIKLAKELDYVAKLPLRIKVNKRFVKLLMILILVENMSFANNTESLILRLSRFNSNLSSFNSAKKEEVNKVFGKNFSSELIEDHRLVALITKGGHNLNRVKERASIMRRLIEQEYD